MITDKTLDEALVEVMRCKRALEALRKARKDALRKGKTGCPVGGDAWMYYSQRQEHAAALRASMDLTRKLADLRAGR